MHASQHRSNARSEIVHAGRMLLLLCCSKCPQSSSACFLCIIDLQSPMKELLRVFCKKVGRCFRYKSSSRAARARQGALLQLLCGSLLVLGNVGGEGTTQQGQRGGQPEQGYLVQPAPKPLQACLLPDNPQSYKLSRRGRCQTHRQGCSSYLPAHCLTATPDAAYPMPKTHTAALL